MSYHNISEVKNDIFSFSNFKNNWDGFGAVTPNPLTIENSILIANLFSSVLPTDVVLMPNGTISFDWHNENGVANLEIGVNKFSFYIESASGFSSSSSMFGSIENFPHDIPKQIKDKLFLTDKLIMDNDKIVAHLNRAVHKLSNNIPCVFDSLPEGDRYKPMLISCQCPKCSPTSLIFS